jgi:hypothetical protein
VLTLTIVRTIKLIIDIERPLARIGNIKGTFPSDIQRKIDHPRSLGVAGRIILKWI